MTEAEYFIVSIGLYKLGDDYQIELSHAAPNSPTQMAPTRGRVSFDFADLRAKELMLDEYGQALAAQLFSDPEIKRRFLSVELAAQVKESFLRLSLCIDPSAAELHSLRWELLRHPENKTKLYTSEKLLFSRFMVSSDWRQVKLRARSELLALVAVSAPPAANLQQMKLAPVDFEAEVKRITTALGTTIKVRVIGGPGMPVTVERLLEELRGSVDILYLACHGQFNPKTGKSALILQDEAGMGKRVAGEEVAGRIAELQQAPRLAVLASCQSGGDGQQVDASGRGAVLPTFATKLAEAGVPAVVAMQGFISMVTVEKMMPVFWSELLRDGQIDRAMAAARGRVQDRDDCWMPALYTRLTNARIWYTPGFADVKKDHEVWRRLLPHVRKGKLVPILGPRLLEAVYGTPHQLALRLAETNRFPFAKHDRDDLPRVMQFVSTDFGGARSTTVEAYKHQLQTNLLELHTRWSQAAAVPLATPALRLELERFLVAVGDHLREENQADPYRILSELPASVYLTTTFDPLLERALVANKRQPQQVITRWRYEKKPAPEPSFTEPSAASPVVYHAFGAFGAFGACGALKEDLQADPDDFDLVLTEDDYFDYLIQTSADKLTPPKVESALCNNSLLFLGFRLTDWHFRVLFRLMMNLQGRGELRNYCHVAVQLDPDVQSMADGVRAKEYLEKYFGQTSNIAIYWGSAEDFLTALRNELAAEGHLASAAPASAPKPEDNDGWT